jgi:hypothetical protein
MLITILLLLVSYNYSFPIENKYLSQFKEVEKKNYSLIYNEL